MVYVYQEKVFLDISFLHFGSTQGKKTSLKLNIIVMLWVSNKHISRDIFGEDEIDDWVIVVVTYKNEDLYRRSI